MTELESRYLLERAASAAEACTAAGCPEHAAAFIRDGYDGEGVRRALAGPAAAPVAAPARKESRDQARPDWQLLEEAVSARLAQQRQPLPRSAA